MAKRKRASVAEPVTSSIELPPLTVKSVNRQKPHPSSLDPDKAPGVIDGITALRASPDGDANKEIVPSRHASSPESPLSDVPDVKLPRKKRVKQAKAADAPTVSPIKNSKVEEMVQAAAARKVALKELRKAEGKEEDPEAEEDEEASPEEIKDALGRPPAVNSATLPLPWTGRLGYACLCTYLRNSNPPVFQSRTTRIASILEHRHPLADPSQPEHATKNRPDKEKPADVRLGQQYIENLCIANCKDMAKIIRWNDKYGIKFMRLSSEAFPFASHAEYGYKLGFASEALAEVGKVAAELGHRLTTHPGQFTQLGSPRKEVIDASFRDLEYHAEFLDRLQLPDQQDRDAVMILHMGGVFGDKEAALQRFRDNYAKLAPNIKKRLVLENDDVSYSVHDLLPICQELNIPLVLDFHHHNIIFDSTKVREGTEDIVNLFPEIRETWTRKNITQKMHYSEPTPSAVTAKHRRKHSPRVATLPPCPPDMDLMIEAKDKEQAVFELMRTFKLPGFEKINNIIPYVRHDDNKPVRAKAVKGEDLAVVEDDEVGMGGPEGRVYWPPGMEEWLRPVKKVVKKKEPAPKPKTIAEKKAERAAAAVEEAELVPAADKAKPKPKANGIKKSAKKEPTPSDSEEEAVIEAPKKKRKSSRKGDAVSYKEESD